jgi:hypothetical protein
MTQQGRERFQPSRHLVDKYHDAFFDRTLEQLPDKNPKYRVGPDFLISAAKLLWAF